AGTISISATGTGGTVTNVTVSAPLSITNPNTIPAISLSKSTSTVDGYLSSVDWNIFNSKQAALINGATINGIVYPATAIETLKVPLAPVVLTDVTNKQYVDNKFHNPEVYTLRLLGSNSGYVELAPAADAGST